MIILDINVLSELTKPTPDQSVVGWLDAQPFDSLWTTAITLFELRYGVTILPAGTRRDRLVAKLEQAVRAVIAGRAVDFDYPPRQRV